ncbi:hypothetical protein CC80DRAFT_591732 [Byssothecium circinans]|uniref:DUF7788 domain-containing protein n=1 Tax=Byssothecium circinans TaxID=147558 RepID=A0A6A5U4D7_9PLEO|nr:hypothetical protein CC80DRAFT_591732 [Byssothecium circinans]
MSNVPHRQQRSAARLPPNTADFPKGMIGEDQAIYLATRSAFDKSTRQNDSTLIVIDLLSHVHHPHLEATFSGFIHIQPARMLADYRTKWGGGRTKPDIQMAFKIIRHLSREDTQDRIKDNYSAAGYQIPQLVFWNLAADSTSKPVTMRDLNTVLVSGYSQGMLKVFLDGGGF